MTSGWLTSDFDLEGYWPEAVDEFGASGSPALDSLLDAARIQCEAYAPALPEGADVPETWRRAQALQARALHRSAIARDGDRIGVDGVAVTVFPMDWTVKRLLRPQRGKAWVR